MGAPQIIWVVLATMSLTYTLVKDGQQREGKHQFTGQLIAFALMAGLLWWGGFFG